MGFKEVVDWKKRMDDNKAKFADGGDYTPFFSLKDGEVVEGLWFNGTEEDDPFIIEVHTINMTEKGRKSFVTVVHNPEECLACFLQREGDKRISKIQNKAIFAVADPRLVHKLLDKENSTNDRKRYKYKPCVVPVGDDDEDVCSPCAKGHKPKPGGQKRWELSMTWANSLATINERLKYRCACKGKLRKGRCDRCDEPRPGSIFQVPFTIQRIGADMTTNYQFKEGNVEDMPDWVAECDPPDMTSYYRPLSAEQQAEKLGVRNPFDRHGAKKYKKKGEEEEDNEVDSIFE